MYTDQLEEMRQLIGNIGLHLSYNHPDEAVKMLGELMTKVQDLKDEVEDQ